MRSTFKVLFYLKRSKGKEQPTVPVMGRITVNGSIAQFSAKLSVPEHLWEVSGGRAKGKSVESDRINRHLDNIRVPWPPDRSPRPRYATTRGIPHGCRKARSRRCRASYRS